MSNKIVNIYAIPSRPNVFFKSLDEAKQVSEVFENENIITLQALWLSETKELFVLAVTDPVKITPAAPFIEDVRKERVKAAALAKLSDEEKELLGIK